MMRSLGTVLLILVLAALVTVVVVRQTGGGTAPALFDARPYEAAKTAASAEKRIFLAKFTADWCPPCKEMNRTTLADPRVEEWVKGHAIAVQVDVDQEGALAQRFDVSGIPTMVAMRGDKEIGRLVGMARADEFLAWLKGLEALE